MEDIELLEGPALLDALRETDLRQVEPEQFARIIAGASKEQLEVVVADRALREKVLTEIFRRMSAHLRPDRAAGLDAVIRWRLTGGAAPDGFDRFETVIRDGACTVSRTPVEKPRVTITVSPVDFFTLITHQATPAVMFVTGRIKVKGDLAFAAGLIGFFDLPKP
ncbi:SCP2 sterol-binding domain-containing protein [Amycolatopsis magusensis]|uniref:Sterol carrier protein n=1 Tax=Amycolatopsis magusensis TaxID=882444 RepID=A0ABS4PLZ5_9PSEU|nr:SCP2 sterol-binding domain-containing protein [Amycolatopsis magusensis]MBP2179874.1 putative sterol carrier protein [Amycolatopsis magusensis]MDI5981428.1 SCP2 sterol-binding domain-containing protein [Amycolatopsis magusensis]